MSKHYPPLFGSTQFHCPHCGVFAMQSFDDVVVNGWGLGRFFQVCLCAHCENYSVWFVPRKSMIHPSTGMAPVPHADMPEDVMKDYNEARSIVAMSPKGAAALLRLALQRLLVHLGEKGENINKDIKSLVQKGLPAQIQQALDSVRIIGNCGVHPGEIKLEDTPEIAYKMFELLNIIVENQITQPKNIAAIYGSMPAGALDGIAKRDATEA